MLNRLRTTLLVITTLLLGNERCAAQSSINGDRFWFGFMANYEDGTNEQLRVYIASDLLTTGTISMPGTGWVAGFTVPANGVINILVPLTAICSSSDTITTQGILIETGHPVTVQALNFQDATADATVVLPETSLGTDYRVLAYRGLSGFGILNSELLVVATEDSTLVEIIPACNTLGGHSAGVAFTVQLDQGETYLLEAADAIDDLTGSLVHIPSPIGCQRLAVFGGSQCTNIPVGCWACDHLYEQMTPVHEWGTRYFTTPFNGPNSYTYRILAAQDSTHCTVNGVVQPMLMSGQYQEFNYSTQAACIEADKPVCVAQYMQGQDCSGGYGDPSMVLVPNDNDPTASVTFSTASSPNLTIHSLNVVTDTANLGFITLDGINVPAQSFSPFAACSDRVWASLPLTNGTHTIQAPSGFSGIVYGTGPNYETYAYSLGAGSRASLDSVICSDSSTVTLTAPVGYGLAIWSFEDTPFDTLAVGPTFTYTPLSNATVIVRDTTLAIACDDAGRYRFDMTNIPLTVDLTAGAPLCGGPGMVMLTAMVDPDTVNVSYTWIPAVTNLSTWQDTATAMVNSSTWFQVVVTSSSGCSAATDSVLVSILPAPAPPIITLVGPDLISSPAQDYQWFESNVPIPGANGQSYTPPFSGWYSIVIVDTNGCSASSAPFYFNYNGISEVLGLSFNAWSPADGELLIDAPLAMERVELYSAVGQLIATQAPMRSSATMTVPGTGIYIVRVHAGEAMGTRKVMVMD